MKALVYYGARDIRLVDIDRPTPGTHEVCIRVRAVAICGTDVSGYKGTSKFREAPLVMGHEFSGDVETVGADVISVQVGQRVTVNPNLYCGKCHYCVEKQENLCVARKGIGTKTPAGKHNGAMAEYIAVPETAVIALPDSVSYEEAALVEPLAVSLRALKHVRRLAKEVVAVVGVGPIGLLAVQCARRLGARTIIALDLVDERLEKAKQLGADVVANSGGDFSALVKAATHQVGVAAAIDAVGVPNSVSQCIQIVRNGGEIVVIGMGSSAINVDTYELVCREISMQGSYIYRDEMREGVEMIANLELDLKGLISSIVPLEKGPEMFARLAAGKTSDIKVILRPE